MTLVGKVQIPKGAKVQYRIGTAITPHSDLIIVDVPEGYIDSTVQKAIDYAISSAEQTNATVGSIQQVQKGRKIGFEVDGKPAKAGVKLSTYFQPVALVDNSAVVIIDIRLASKSGGGVASGYVPLQAKAPAASYISDLV
jgi:hypothetical protein